MQSRVCSASPINTWALDPTLMICLNMGQYFQSYRLSKYYGPLLPVQSGPFSSRLNLWSPTWWAENQGCSWVNFISRPLYRSIIVSAGNRNPTLISNEFTPCRVGTIERRRQSSRSHLHSGIFIGLFPFIHNYFHWTISIHTNSPLSDIKHVSPQSVINPHGFFVPAPSTPSFLILLRIKTNREGLRIWGNRELPELVHFQCFPIQSCRNSLCPQNQFPWKWKVCPHCIDCLKSYLNSLVWTIRTACWN